MARDYQYLFSQLRRIEDHREAGSEKEIRKLYKQILKEVRHFIADEYAQYAEDGKLTFDILRSKGQDARFLQEIEMRFGDMSLDVSRQIKKTTEEMYQLSYDGLREAVQKSKDAEELKEQLQMPDMNTAQTMWATVDNTIMDVALEKNHKNIIWDIKREIATALAVGDRFDTMAQRLSKTLNGNYKKAILISRTEVGRVREAGHLASAKNLNETLKKGSSGLRMVKKWKSMKDGAVRDHHRSMHDKIVEMDDYFELPDGVKTQAPKQSGYARHDCNCRCTALYPMMDDEKFFKETGKHFKEFSENRLENSVNSAIMNDVEMFKRKSDRRSEFKNISDRRFNELTIEARKNGAQILRGTPEVEKHLESMGATASTIGNVLLFRADTKTGEVVEETYHFMQNLAGLNDDNGEPLRTYLNEIDAKKYIIGNAGKLGVPRNEVELAKEELEWYEKLLAEYMGGDT